MDIDSTMKDINYPKNVPHACNVSNGLAEAILIIFTINLSHFFHTKILTPL